MALILNIDTAVQWASVCLADDENILGTTKNPSKTESASWLHTAIKSLLFDSKRNLQEVEAVAISAGPGSYTGLRVGMAAAKGLCYAMSKPLIAINTLQMMAAAADNSFAQLLCPMIDARRMEVFTALYDSSLSEILPSTNMILEKSSFEEWLQKNSINFFGNGSTKAASLIDHQNSVFSEVESSAVNMVGLSVKKFERHQFADLAYTQPSYGKGFHSPVSQKKY